MKSLQPVAFLLFLITVVIATPANAQRQRQAQARSGPNDSFELTEASGPWLIMCASFVGEEAEIQALELARELRATVRGEAGLDAFIYRKHFDFSDSIQGLGFDETAGIVRNGVTYAKQKKMRTNIDESFDEIAVLVGAFPTIEDGRAQQTLQYIKYMMPRSLGKIRAVVDESGSQDYVPPESSDNQRMRIWRSITKTVNADADKRKGPMGAAFLLANPLLPDEYFANQVDAFVLKINRERGIRHSLLDNTSPYSVRVATFAGASTLETNKIAAANRDETWRLKNGKSIKESKLALAIAKAHRLTTELRKLGIPAYEFHDRIESYVCVGGFDWLKRTNDYGEEIQNPEMVRAIELFKGTVENFPGVQGAVRPKSLSDVARLYGSKRRIPNLQKLGVVFDVQPLPVIVPRNH